MEQMTKQGVTVRQFDEFWAKHKPYLVELIKELIPTIDDDYRAFEYDDEYSTPGIQITISNNTACTTWSYQTGDNSYTGSCYGDPYWGVGAIYRDSNPEDVATELIDNLAQFTDFIEE